MPDIFVRKPTEDEAPKIDPGVAETNETQKNKEEAIDMRKQVLEFKGHKDHLHNHLTAAYCERPTGVSFADKLENEVLLLYLRKHFVTNVPWIVSAIALILVPLIFVAINGLGILPIDFLPPVYVTMILLLYYFFIAGFIFVHYLTWFYNIDLVTNQRILDIDFSSLVFENVDATKLTQVEDVGYKQVGIIRSIFDYGDIHLNTAGPSSNFEFNAVPHPERVINTINDLIGRTRNA